MADRGMTRRRFDAWGTAISGAVVSVTLGVPIIGFLLSPIFQRRERDVERRVGPIDLLPDGEPVRFEVDFPQNAWPVPDQAHTVYVVKHGDKLDVFANTCTHMQCPVHFQKDLNQFLCPCHGGLYDLHGQNVGGPPPKPLPRYISRVEKGVLYVQNRLDEEI